MKQLSTEAEAALLSAIEQAAEFVNAGHSPNDAITKAAEVYHIPPGHIGLMVHAYNTGRTKHQLEHGHDPFSKTAGFEMADTAAVLEQLYPTVVKTAAARVAETIISPEYSLPPSWLHEHERLEKAAELLQRPQFEVSAPAPYPGTPGRDYFKQAAALQRQQCHVAETRREASDGFDKLASCLCAVEEYFRRPGSLPFGDVRQTLNLVYGERGEKVAASLLTFNPRLEKQAASRGGLLRFDPDSEPYKMITALMQSVDEYQVQRQAFEKLAAETAAQEAALRRPFVLCPSRSVLDAASSTEEKQAGAGAFLGGLGIGASKDWVRDMASTIVPSSDELVNKQYQKLTDPAHDAELRAIKSHAMLTHMMTNDPIISSYDPHEVATAFNELQELLPHLADKHMPMRTLLRKRLTQGTLDPFEVDQILQMETRARPPVANHGGQHAKPASVLA